MIININEIKFKINLATNEKMPDLFARVSLVLLEEHKRHFTISGFTIRKSKYDSKPYLLPPSQSKGKSFFKFVLMEESLWKEIETEVIKEYEKATIPIID